MTERDKDEPGTPGSTAVEQRRGSMAYRNWEAMRRAAGAEPAWGYEVLLFSDVRAVGGHWVVGPYEVINTISGPAHAMGVTAPPIALRVWGYLGGDDWLPPLSTTDVSAYTGTDLADEIAALLALLTARRLRAGGMVRRFDSKADPGSPYADAGVTPPVVPPAGYRLLPRQTEPCALADERRDLLASYVDLPPQRAVALARAARAYRDALWVGESQPELAWLLLVSAVECAANTDARDAADDPLVRLRASRKPLANKLARSGLSEEDQRTIAKEIAHLFKATEKFVEFLVRFGPKAGPEPRPPHGVFPWSDVEATRVALTMIYEHRSNALHEALPIPVPMLGPPHRWVEGTGFDEIPLGLSSGALGGAWRREDTPMLLHAFEFAVQHALVAWWRESAAPAPT